MVPRAPSPSSILLCRADKKLDKGIPPQQMKSTENQLSYWYLLI